VTPANASIAVGTTQQFTATGTYSDGSTQNLTSTATWSSSASAVATISTTGLASAVGLGQATIEAALGSVMGSTTLNVTPGFVLTGSLNTARQQHTATLLNNGMVLIAGGTGSSAFLASAELYNPGTGTFTLTGSLNTARFAHTATLLNNGMVLIAGGLVSTGSSTSAELYNPTTGIFTPTGSLNNAREAHTATLLNNGMVLVAGGIVPSGSSTSAELYNPATGTFTPTGGLNTARWYHTATLLNNGMVLMAGGMDSSGLLASAELYDPTAATFTPTGSLNTARQQHTATLLNNGMVLVAGGGSSGFLASAELYDPTAATFTPTGSLNTAREAHTATLLNDGTVLMAGGGGSGGFLASAELYDPTAATFTPTGSLNTARWNHTATLLNNGMVLIAGGGGSGGFLAGAELYEPATATTITSVSVSCNPTSVGPGQTSPCTATVSGTGSYNSAVTWSASAGTINSSGMFTAPAAVGTVTVTATSVQDTSKSGNTTVTVTTSTTTITSVSVSCNPASVATGQTSQCTATVTGTGSYSSAVNWSVNSVQGGNSTVGTISSSGLYTAPSTVPSPNPVTVTATSVADTTQSGSASVAITSASVAVAVSPPSATAQTGDTLQFSASVTGTTNSAVNWSVNGIGGGNSTVGTISSTGFYTAPATVPSPNTIAVTAASVVGSAVSNSASVLINPACQSPAAAMTDVNGNATVCSGGFTFPLQVFDEDTGNAPISSTLAVGVAVDPTRPGRAIAFISDPSQQYPFQAIILVAPSATGDVTSPSGSETAATEVPAPVAVPARIGSGSMLNAVREYVATNNLSGAPTSTFLCQDLANLVSLGAQSLGGLAGANVSITASSTIPIAQFGGEMLTQMASAKGLMGVLGLGATSVLGPLPAAYVASTLEALEGVSLVNEIGNEGTAFVYQQMGATGVVVYTITGTLSSPIGPIPQLEIPCPVYPNGITNIFTNAPPLQVNAGGEAATEIIGANALLGLGLLAPTNPAGQATLPLPVDSYVTRVGAQGYLPATQNIQQTSGGSTLNVTLQPITPFGSATSGITYMGQFSFQYNYPDPSKPNGPPIYGAAGFSLTVTLQQMAPPVEGLAVYQVTYASASSPFFGCQLGCAASGTVILPVPPENVSTQDGGGFEIAFPNGATLTTYNDAGAMHMSSDGRIISNSLDPSIQPVNTWTTTVWTAENGMNSFEQYVLPALNPVNAYLSVTHASWALTWSSF
jgi:Big-like domain-containing protein/galactose oxidase-like protein